MGEATSTTLEGTKFGQRVRAGGHDLVADEPTSVGGEDRGPGPFDFLATALATCSSMTVKMYADHKGWPLARIQAKVTVQSAQKPGDPIVFRRTLILEGPLEDEQRARLLEIAKKCPVARALGGPIVLESELAPAGAEISASPSTT
jgi:putative redox protein